MTTSYAFVRRICFGALVAFAALLTLADNDAAGFGRHNHGLAPGQAWVRAESQYGHGSVSAPVRYTSKGPQIRLPGGSWLYCDHLCSETLRLATVDFWESESADRATGDGGCGLLTCRFNRRLNY